jgi:hypothetical protein
MQLDENNKNYTAIEILKQVKGTPDAVFEGVKAQNGWKNGKMVPEEDYDKAVDRFNSAPMDGREAK